MQQVSITSVINMYCKRAVQKIEMMYTYIAKSKLLVVF